MLTSKNIPKFDAKIYNQIALNDLVTCAVYFLSQEKEKISSENITAMCFLLFPERFSLRGYPQWPDSTVVNKRWIDCRNRGYITGSTAQDFSLTSKGLELAEKVRQILEGRKRFIPKGRAKIIRSEMRTRAGRFVRSIEDSDAFKMYKVNKEKTIINEFDFRSMLLCTMESSSSTLSKNLTRFMEYAEEYNRQDLVEFLNFCQVKLSNILKNYLVQPERVRGGMLPKK